MKILVIAPHADDETLGCGGTILRHKLDGNEIFWLTITSCTHEGGFSEKQIETRAKELAEVAKRYEFTKTYHLGYPAAQLDTVSKSELVKKIGIVFSEINPELVYLPYYGDAHSDHAATFEAAASCTKWFRHPSVKRVMAYETISETDSSLHADTFKPNVFINISEQLQKKIEIMQIYASEIKAFPFPRSVDAIIALAKVRGASSGFAAAESFLLLRDRY